MRNRDFDKCFPIGIYWPPPAAFMDDIQYDLLKEAHINVVLNTCVTDLNSVQDNICMLKKCEVRNMKTIVADRRFEGIIDSSEKEIDEIIDDYKDYKALAGFYLKDEPEIMDWDKFAKVYLKLLERFPHCIPYINLSPTYDIDKMIGLQFKGLLPEGLTGHDLGIREKHMIYRHYYERWVELAGDDNAKYISYDHYPFKSEGLSEDYFLNLELIRSIGINYNIKTHCYLQSVGIDGILQRPDENRMRWNVFTCLAYGMKALSWFTWWTPQGTETESFTDAIIDRYGSKTDLYMIVQKLNLYIKSLGSTLVNLTSQNVYHYGEDIPAGTQELPDDFFWQVESGNDCIISYYTRYQERKYIMVVNKSMYDYNDYIFKINPKPKDITEISKDFGCETKTSYNHTTGIVSVNISPGEGALFALPFGY